jgi:hypothetical protein
MGFAIAAARTSLGAPEYSLYPVHLDNQDEAGYFIILWSGFGFEFC